MQSIFYELFPINRKHLLGKITGNSIISEMSENQFRSMIIGCLTGENPRFQTENWAQSKIFHGVFTGLIEMFDSGKRQDDSFIINSPIKAASYLLDHRINKEKKLIPDDKTLCQWIVNLTDKGFDNILQGNPDNLIDWAHSVKKSVQDVNYGNVEQNIKNIALYNASLAKKGGLKSAMGNLFEPLLLFTGMSSCGLKYTSRDLTNSLSEPSFTLNVTEGRQSDARVFTCLTTPKVIDIDIGFIGKGNPEIIADKTQRFGNIVGGEKPLKHTIIIVSAIPKTEGAQLVVRQATLLGAKVITMSGNNWVYELSKSLQDVGLKGITNIPSDKEKARVFINENLMLSKDIIESIPNSLSIPTSWI